MIYRLIVFALVASVASPSFAQLSSKNKKAIELYTEADNYRVRGQFMQALDLVQQAISKDKNFVEAWYRQGLIYANMKDVPHAISSFEKALTLTSDPKKQKVIWFDLGDCYLMSGDYAKAITVLKQYIQVENQNKQKSDRASMMVRNAEFALASMKEDSGYRIRPLSDTVNCFPMQYFPVLTADESSLIFTRRLGNGGEHDEDLVIAHKDTHGRWTRPESLSKNINSFLNEGTCTISADGRKLIFTSCVGRQGFGSCDLFESVRIGNEWTAPKNLGPTVNSGDWESQPTLSADGRTLYFVSDRRGGIGRRDIWMTTLDDNGNWNKAVNVGAPVNTVYDEISPFIHVNNQVLYFASNGQTGFGGYDIFYSERGGQKWTAPVNMGSPINTYQDQFSLFITADGKRGYYSHEDQVPSGKVASRIYEITIPEDKQIQRKSNYIKGVVTDKETHLPLQARIELVDIQRDTVLARVESDSVTGEYLMVLTDGSEYALYINRQHYLFQSLNFDYSGKATREPIIRNIELMPVKKGSVAVLKNIFFDFDKYDLKEKSKPELQKIIRFLQENPTVHIEIGGHTDNAGSAVYNQQLSEKRAQAVYRYLVNAGIDMRRLSAKGYGASRPVDTNDTDEGRQANRRIEFTVK